MKTRSLWQIAGMIVLAASAGLARAGTEVVIDQQPGANPWTHLNFKNDPADFQFGILADRNGGNRPGVFEDAVRKMNLLQPEFVMCIGDLIEGGAQDDAELERQWDEVNAALGQLEMPFFYVQGNHDVAHFGGAREIWKRRYGRQYYHFRYADVLFLCLSSEDPEQWQMSKEQADYACRVLAENRDVRWTFLFFHKPMWANANAKGWAEIEAALQGRSYTVFAGHTHDYLKYDRNGQDYIVLATTGGSWGQKGRVGGEFDQIAWVTMRNDGPRIVNLMVEGIADENIRTEKSVELVESLLDRQGVNLKPIMVSGPRFTDGATELLLNNTTSVPFQFRAVMHPTPQLSATPAVLEKTVSPGESVKLPVSVKACRPTDITALDPLRMTWTATYALGDQPPVQIQHTDWLIVDTRFECTRHKKPVAIDGRLNDWSELPILCRQPARVLGDPDPWQGPGDASFRFGAAYDNDWLYIAVDVSDDVMSGAPGGVPGKPDGLIIMLDARPESERGTYSKDFKEPGVLRLSVRPDVPKEEMTKSFSANVPADIQMKCGAKRNGYAAELAIPASFLSAAQDGSWDSFRLNIVAADFDSLADGGIRIPWRADWTTPAGDPRSGTFVRH